MSRMILIFFISVIAVFFNRYSIAAETKKTDSLNDVKFTGFVDISANYLLRENRFTSGTYNREFDLEPNGLTLQQAALTISKEPPEGLGGLLNMVLGRDAITIALYGTNPRFGIQNIGFTIPQAYLQYATPTFTVMGGEILNLAGIEMNDYTLDTNFSRSILFGYAQPGSEIGARGTYTVNPQLNLFLGINNGWYRLYEIGEQNSFEGGFIYNPNQQVSLQTTLLTGTQYLTDDATSGATGQRSLIDIIGQWKITEKLNIAANYDYGLQSQAALPASIGRAVWQGITGYVNYIFNPKWQTSFRAEIFEDSNGYRTGVRQNWREATLTLGYSPLKDLLIRAETRRDFSNADSFIDRNGVTVSNNQQSFALEALWTF